MSDTEVPQAPVSAKRSHRPSAVWIVPIVALVLGLYLVYTHYQSLGPETFVTFETAEGIVAGKTKVQARSVEVGEVESVRLSKDLKSVHVGIRLAASASELLHSGTQFWVVRARVGGSGISGLGTLLSGAYIELDPGAGPVEGRLPDQFVGLEQPPVTPQGVPGLRITLVAEEAGSLGPGSPITFRGINAGRIETRHIDPLEGIVTFDAFINDEFHKLVTSNTRFWNASGIDVTLDANGIAVRTGGLQSIISGGVAFGISEGEQRGIPVGDGTIFGIRDSEDAATSRTLIPRLSYLLLFESSVRGLSVGAPVEFRGIKVGSVSGISIDYAPDDPMRRIPVLIEIDPGLIGQLPQDASDEAAAALVSQAVKDGLRARLKTGSLVTGQLFVDLDFDPDADATPGTIAQVGNYETLPTASAGLARIEDKVVKLLEKINALDLDSTVTAATDSLNEVKETAAAAEGTVRRLESATESLDKLLSSEDTTALPGDLRATLTNLQKTLEGFDGNSALQRDLALTMAELRDTLESVKILSDSVERKPNSLIFGRGNKKVTPPRGTN